MAKHNKKRNTAFIYEALVREIVKQSVAKNNEKRNAAIQIMKEAFSPKTELRKELDLYKTLMENNSLQEKIAEKILIETKLQHNQINQEQLFKEQSIAISKINKELSKSVFNNFVPNYKYLATISQIFGSTSNPKTKVLLESQIVEKLTSKKEVEDAVSARLLPESALNIIDKGTAVSLYEKKNVTEAGFLSFFDIPAFNPATGKRSGKRGTRKDQLAKYISGALAYDATLEVAQQPDVIEKRQQIAELKGETIAITPLGLRSI